MTTGCVIQRRSNLHTPTQELQSQPKEYSQPGTNNSPTKRCYSFISWFFVKITLHRLDNTANLCQIAQASCCLQLRDEEEYTIQARTSCCPVQSTGLQVDECSDGQGAVTLPGDTGSLSARPVKGLQFLHRH